MKNKILSFLTVILMVFSCFFITVSSLEIKTNSNENPCTGFFDGAELPEWYIGSYWKYNMEFEFLSREGGSITFNIEAEIEDLYATVIDITYENGDELYVMNLNGYISGVVSLFSAEIEIADFRGPLTGEALIGTNTLGIRSFLFDFDGEVNIPLLGWNDMFFDMSMTFTPCFDFFDFPIEEEEPDWDVVIDPATLEATVDIPVLGPLGEGEFSSSMVFNDVMSVKGTEEITVPAGTYDTYLLGGTWGDPSNLWYAPTAGYLAQVDETLDWENGSVESLFYLELEDTNYDTGNYPPNNPDKPYGQTNGEIEEEYAYTTKTNDPNGDKVYYWFDWGDGENSGWVGPYNSGVPANAYHMWYNKGVYNVVAKAKDENGVESGWSQPLSVMIMGDPVATLNMYKVKEIDDLDVGTDPELYYTVHIESEGTSPPPQSHHNTDDGTYNGNWVTSTTWTPDKDHEFDATSREVITTIKVMDYDSIWELGSDDLADTSGCVGDGVDNDIYPPEDVLRGAVFHGTYDMVDKELKPYSSDPNDFADFYYKEDGYYITCGNYQPDNSQGYDGNDAKVWFKLYSDYYAPQAYAQILDMPGTVRPYVEYQFAGTVTEGTPSYIWHWDFGDGTTIEDEQNPKHTYTDTGTFTVTLTVTDGFEQTGSYSFVIEVVNIAPLLSNGKVEWTGRGNTKDTFTFSVDYLDIDGDCPSIHKVFIDGEGKTLDGFGSSDTYSVSMLGSEIGSGNHIYYFHFEDGHGGSAQTTEKSFTVRKGRSRNFDLQLWLAELFEQFPILKQILDL